MARNKKDGVRQVEEESQREYLDELIKDFIRKQTIQDVGLFLVNYSAFRLPDRLADVLSEWLEKTSDRTVAYSHPGHPKSELSDYFPLIDGMRVTGMSAYKACHLIVDKLELHDVNPNTLNKRYGQHRTPESRFIDDLSVGPARPKNPGGIDYTQLEKATFRAGFGRVDTSVDKRINKLIEKFGLQEVKRAINDHEIGKID